MNSKNYRKCLLNALALVAMPFCAATSQAQLNFHVTVPTSQLMGNPSAPFSINFQLNSGNTLGNNTATISNFTFGGGGAAFGSPNFLGGASGSLLGTITLTDTNAFNEFFQSFTAGSTLAFDVSLTLGVDSGATPDAFSFSLLDNTLANIPTNGLGDSLLLVNLNGNSPSVQTFSGTGAFNGVTASAIVVPEPSTLALLGFAGLAVAVFGRKVACGRRV